MIALGGAARFGEVGEGGQNVQTSSYEINKSWGMEWNIQREDPS